MTFQINLIKRPVTNDLGLNFVKQAVHYISLIYTLVLNSNGTCIPGIYTHAYVIWHHMLQSQFMKRDSDFFCSSVVVVKTSVRKHSTSQAVNSTL